MSTTTEGLRERTRRAVRAELASAAMTLFLSQGFAGTTTGEIAETAGVSRSSFFRYFLNKDDVLAYFLTLPGDEMARQLRTRDAEEAPWVALRRCMDPLVASMSGNPRALEMTRMMLTGDALRASHMHKQQQWRAALAESVAERLPPTLTDTARRVHANALAGAAVSALTAAEIEWVRSDAAEPLADLVDAAMAAVAPIS